MKKTIYIFIACIVALTSCRHNHSHDHDHEGHSHNHDHDHDHEGHSDEESDTKSSHPGAITFSEEQSSKIDFVVELPAMEPMGQVIQTTARILSDQTDETIIAARTAGIVLFAGNSIVEGKSVASGQELFSVSGAGMAENSINVRLSEAQNNYAKMESDYLRAQELAKEQIVSEKELRQVKSDYETAKAIYDNLYENFSANGQRVSGPINGFVKQLFVANGQYVDAGQPLISISKNKSLLLKADVPSRYATLLPRIASANIRKPNDSEVYSLENLNGKVLSFGKSVNENNHLIPVHFQIDNKAGFIPGSFVEVFIKTKSEHEVLSIPKESLVESQGVFFVFVRIEPELYEKREVKPGVTDGIRTEIVSGLSPDDEVVTKGAMSVKLAEASGSLDPHAGHAH